MHLCSPVHCLIQGVPEVHAESVKQGKAKKGKKQRQKAKLSAQQAQQALQDEHLTEQNSPMQQAQQAQDQSQQAQQTRPIQSTTEQELTVQQALDTHEQPQQAQPLSSQTTEQLPERKADLSSVSSSNMPLSALTGMHDETQQTTHKDSGPLSNAAPCPSLEGADYSAAQQKQPAIETASPPLAAHAHASPFTSIQNNLANTVRTDAEQAPSSSSSPSASIQLTYWAASSPELMCCPLTQVSPAQVRITCTISSMLPVCRLLVSGKMHEEYASRGGSRSLQLNSLHGCNPQRPLTHVQQSLTCRCHLVMVCCKCSVGMLPAGSSGGSGDCC